MLVLLPQHQLQQILVDALHLDLVQLQPRLNRVVQAASDDVPVLLVSLQRLDVDQALLIRHGHLCRQQVVV